MREPVHCFTRFNIAAFQCTVGHYAQDGRQPRLLVHYCSALMVTTRYPPILLTYRELLLQPKHLWPDMPTKKDQAIITQGRSLKKNDIFVSNIHLHRG